MLEEVYVLDAGTGLFEGISCPRCLKVWGHEGQGNPLLALRQSKDCNNMGKIRNQLPSALRCMTVKESQGTTG